MNKYTDIVLREIAGLLPRIPEEASQRFFRELSRARQIYLAGVGRSGLVVQTFGQRLMHLGLHAHLAHEITAPAISRGDLLVACSATGRTILPLYMARRARRIGARVVCLTACPRSALARSAHLVVTIPAPLEQGPRTRQPARSLFEQTLFIYLDSMILMAMHELKITRVQIRRRHANLE